jgi:hypothetical protein
LFRDVKNRLGHGNGGIRTAPAKHQQRPHGPLHAFLGSIFFPLRTDLFSFERNVADRDTTCERTNCLCFDIFNTTTPSRLDYRSARQRCYAGRTALSPPSRRPSCAQGATSRWVRRQLAPAAGVPCTIRAASRAQSVVNPSPAPTLRSPLFAPLAVRLVCPLSLFYPLAFTSVVLLGMRSPRTGTGEHAGRTDQVVRTMLRGRQ